ncbi:MAG: IS66 family transposase [Bacteroidales bacterium]|nr:IS66 family transposase [Bacteroidales bacterium]
MAVTDGTEKNSTESGNPCSAFPDLSNCLSEYSVPSEIIGSIQETIVAFQRSLEEYRICDRKKDQKIAALEEQIACLKRVIFGPRREKSPLIAPNQGILFPNDTDVATQAKVEVPAKSKETDIPKKIAPKRKRSQKDIYDALPHDTKTVPIHGEVLQWYKDKGMLVEKVGKEFIRTEVIHIPEIFKCIDVFAEKYKVTDLASGVAKYITAEVPAPLIEHSFASASLVSHIISNKYQSGLPLYRQEQIFKHRNFPLSRTTMANMTIKVSDLYLKRLYLRLHRLIIEGNVIHSDETPIQVLKEPGRKAQKKSYMWVLASSKRSERQIRLFFYRASRAGDCARKILEGFSGVLISDGYSAYDTLQIIRGGCWAHMRRKWFEAIPTGVPSGGENARIGLKFCDKLFAFEHSIESLSDDERLHARNMTSDKDEPQSAREILKEYWEWVDSFNEKEISGKLKTAIVYAKNQKEYLNTFLEHGEIEISNNQVENAIRPFVVGRKGWLFSDSVDGADASAVIYSLIETAKANNLNPEQWIEHVLSVLPERFAYDPNDNVDDLLPWADDMQAKFKQA